MRTRTSFFTRAGAIGAVVVLAACGPDAATAVNDPGSPAMSRSAAAAEASSGAGWSVLGEVRAATARYHQVDRAIADGYVNTRICAASPDGAMGVHYVNTTLRSDATFDPFQPEVLIYEPMKNGNLRLVAVEYVIWRANWDAAHPTGPGPEFLGQPFFQSFGPRAHGEADHYELHAWVWRHNPDGMFAQWNPEVTCAYAPQP